MPTENKVKTGTPIVFADATDFVAGTHGLTQTKQLDLTSLANGAARQSEKVDLGATRAAAYDVFVGFEFDVAPTAGVAVEVYWSESHSGTAGTGNAGGCSGADGAYKAGEEDEWKGQLEFLGQLKATADAAPTVQMQKVGVFCPGNRYGQVVVVNKGGQAFEGDAVEMFVALIPIVDEFQN